MTVDQPTLEARAEGLGIELQPGDRVLLEGPLGAGKSTFARALIRGFFRARGEARRFEGSPSFALVHEYPFEGGVLAHVDLYRIQSEEEIADAGIEDLFRDSTAVVVVEWLSNCPRFQGRVSRAGQGRRWNVALDFTREAAPTLRLLRIQ